MYKMEKDGRYELVYSFGWYLKKMIDDTREKGATPILLSLTPRNLWIDGKIHLRKVVSRGGGTNGSGVYRCA